MGLLGAAGLGAAQGIGAGLAAVGQQMMQTNAASEAADALALKEYNLRMLMEDHQDTRDETKSDREMANRKEEQQNAADLADRKVNTTAMVGGQYVTQGALDKQGMINADAIQRKTDLDSGYDNVGEDDPRFNDPSVTAEDTEYQSKLADINKGVIPITSEADLARREKSADRLIEQAVLLDARAADKKRSDDQRSEDRRYAAELRKEAADERRQSDKQHEQTLLTIAKMGNETKKYGVDNKPVTPAEINQLKIGSKESEDKALIDAERWVEANPDSWSRNPLSSKPNKEDAISKKKQDLLYPVGGSTATSGGKKPDINQFFK